LLHLTASLLRYDSIGTVLCTLATESMKVEVLWV